MQSEALQALDLEALGDGRFRGSNQPNAFGVVHGGQFIGQMIVAASRTLPDKRVRSINTILSRIAKADLTNDIDVEVVHAGRVFGSLTVTFRQAGRICGRAQVLMAGEEADLIRHGVPMPVVPQPEDAVPLPHDQVTVPGELRAPKSTGRDLPGSDLYWFRYEGAPDDPGIQRALLAPPTALFLIGRALQEHPEVQQDRPHVSVDSAILTHAMYFHEEVRVNDWMLLAQDSPFAGAGQAYGRGQAFTREGTLVASYDQESLIRGMHEWSRKD